MVLGALQAMDIYDRKFEENVDFG
jgi:hypothetical protein